MKPLLALCGIFLALCTAPAFADSFDSSNHGLIASSDTGGITALTAITNVNKNGIPLTPGTGLMIFNTGTFLGSLQSGGTFSDGQIAIQFDAITDTIFASNFSGTWSKLGDDLFKLLGTFSGNLGTLQIHGTTTQMFEIEFENGQACFKDLNGTTTITTVPEPGTLALLGSGLVGLGGAIRRKFKSVTN